MASFRAAATFEAFGFSLNRYPAAVGSYAAHASHIATERWKRLRACTGGLGRERRIASRTASSQRRTTDQLGPAIAGQGSAGSAVCSAIGGAVCCHGRVTARGAPITVTTASSTGPGMPTTPDALI